MNSFKPFAVGSLLGSGIMFVALQYHVVQSHEGFRIVPRTPQHALGLAYADVRHWDAEKWADRPELTRALVAHGSTDLIAESVAGSITEAVSAENSTLDQLRGFLNESQSGDAADTSFRLPVPADAGSFSAPPPSSGSSTSDDLFTIPFEQDARKSSAGNTAQRSPAESAEYAQSGRDTLPSVDDVFGGRSVRENVAVNDNRTIQDGRPASGGTDSFSASRADFGGFSDAETPSFGSRYSSENSSSIGNFGESFSSSPSSTYDGAESSSSFEEESQKLEDLLFGADTSDPTAKTGTTSSGTATSPLSGNTSGFGSTSSPRDFGSFGDTSDSFDNVTNALKSRAEQAMDRLRSRTEQADTNWGDSADSPARYVRDRAASALSDAVDSFAPNSGIGGSQIPAGSALPDPLNAIREGFDPFIK
ncbi:MAG: hypothetical protein KDA89_14645 [Planctomycetaceae bacterium]|nr:hypothetical protein [Planctomycetaceae bacterium]